MGRHQREKARAKRAAFKLPSQPDLTSISAQPSSSTLSPLASNSSPSPHHVDLLRVAFLEWLLPLKHLTSPHELWDRFMSDWSAIPSHELPVQSSRPVTLFSHVRALRSSNNMGALRKEVREGRAKLTHNASEDEGGLRSHQTLLQWYLEGGDGTKEQPEKVAAVAQRRSVDEAAEQVEEQQPQATKAGLEHGYRAKRRRTDAAPDDDGGEGLTASKRRTGVLQQLDEHAVSSPLATTVNIWDALADG